MVLTKAELTGSLQNEIRILLHLASKVDPGQLDYRPTPKQRSTIELLKYLSLMGPFTVEAAKTGTFDVNGWTAAQEATKAKNFEQVLADIAAIPASYAAVLDGMPDEAFRDEVELFGRKTTRGAFMVNTILGGYAAYRTQLFCYLKACGREELNTMNLWAGMDPAPAQ
jgi:hypothetical protein